jgi:hypothetical protein
VWYPQATPRARNFAARAIFHIKGRITNESHVLGSRAGGFECLKQHSRMWFGGRHVCGSNGPKKSRHPSASNAGVTAAEVCPVAIPITALGARLNS